MRDGWGLLAALSVLVTGCGGIALPDVLSDSAAPQSEATVSGEPVVSVEAPSSPATPLPESGPQPPGVLTLEVWTIESLRATAETRGGVEFISQLAAFEADNPGVQVEVLPKRVSGRGSALDYLRTAPPVAPSVLPDLVLLNRDALVLAAREGLIVPWDVAADDSLLALENDLYPAVSGLGRVDGTLVGMPYMLEMRHALYRSAIYTAGPPTSYEDVLDGAGASGYIFPAAATNSLNRTTLLQYVAVGGSFEDEAGNPFVDADALASVLTFYEEAFEEGVLDASVLQFAPADTLSAYMGGRGALADVNSASYLAARENVLNSGLASVPTADGGPITYVSGWMWALVTRDPARQALAARLVTSLAEPVGHGSHSQAAGYLPSQPAALAVWGESDPYVAFADGLLGAAILPLDPSIDSSAGAAMQAAVEDVLLGRATPRDAAARAAATINSSEN